jgi:site-specific recombinase XerD
VPFFGHLRVATITTADINRYIARRQEEQAANATINRELSALKRAFTRAVARKAAHSDAA